MKKTVMLNIIFILIILFSIAGGVQSVSYRNYNYNFWEEPVPAPQAYLPEKMLDNTKLDIKTNLNNPQDIFIDHKDRLYIADSGNDRIICLDKNWEVKNVIDEFKRTDKKMDSFNSPQGITVTRNEEIYVADRNNGRIVVLNLEGELKKILTGPEPEEGGVISKDFKFRPRKIAVDKLGRVYVISSGVYDGIMQFDNQGIFRGFIGAPRISPNPIDFLWSRIATEAQKDRMKIFLPTEYSNLAIDERGFIYATISSGSVVEEDEVIKRLNPSGEDTLVRRGFHPPVGDIDYPLESDYSEDTVTGRSVLIDITYNNGRYSVLDGRRGRIFTYNSEGVLLYTFGGLGDTKGMFGTPAAVDSIKDKLVVLDSKKNTINIFAPTEYAQNIHAALDYYQEGKYDSSLEKWNKVLSDNGNFEYAYTGLGLGYLREDNYSRAMKKFKRGNNRNFYSDALQYYRREVIESNFDIVFYSLIFLIIMLFFFVRFGVLEKIKEKGYLVKLEKEKQKYSKKFINALSFSIHLIFHPFGGFWELKEEKRGNIISASVLLLLVIASYVFVRQYTGFIFNKRDLNELNILFEAATIIIPFLLWCTVNWSLTTLMEGKGNFKEISISTAYALTPLIILNFPITIISDYLIQEEGMFYYAFLVLAVFWTSCLLFFGMMTIHEYTLPKTFFTTILTIIGIGIVLFIGLLFYSVVNQLVQFITDIYAEIVFRI